MNTRDYPTLCSSINSHKRTYPYIAVLHFTVTMVSSTMKITQTLKWVWNSP